ncbi:hypothetical protein BJ085DRAFT_34979 [Dimargaris cristalligena]|uniref:Uncharacterized protein n=1 Tax=Dimargaris cristalligena TaxID=215637 RepID=A0A4P9ZNU2_9FUNG|nr:hypothetical protein BJ085DRAFT_34979 [Dimargaris cristalligena]|eukprot:RKP34828.1 hypothetical protein BJ085DRAFT_34979 [Dimargaris cristalligena]
MLKRSDTLVFRTEASSAYSGFRTVVDDVTNEPLFVKVGPSPKNSRTIFLDLRIPPLYASGYPSPPEPVRPPRPLIDAGLARPIPPRLSSRTGPIPKDSSGLAPELEDDWWVGPDHTADEDTSRLISFEHSEACYNTIGPEARAQTMGSRRRAPPPPSPSPHSLPRRAATAPPGTFPPPAQPLESHGPYRMGRKYLDHCDYLGGHNPPYSSEPTGQKGPGDKQALFSPPTPFTHSGRGTESFKRIHGKPGTFLAPNKLLTLKNLDCPSGPTSGPAHIAPPMAFVYQHRVCPVLWEVASRQWRRQRQLSFICPQGSVVSWVQLTKDKWSHPKGHTRYRFTWPRSPPALTARQLLNPDLRPILPLTPSGLTPHPATGRANAISGSEQVGGSSSDRFPTPLRSLSSTSSSTSASSGGFLPLATPSVGCTLSPTDGFAEDYYWQFNRSDRSLGCYDAIHNTPIAHYYVKKFLWSFRGRIEVVAGTIHSPEFLQYLIVSCLTILDLKNI